MSKKQRNEQRVSPREVAKIQQLYHKYHVDKSLIAERFGIDESNVTEILTRPVVAPSHHKWRVKWDDENGDRQERTWETFRAARLFHASVSAEWSRIEPV